MISFPEIPAGQTPANPARPSFDFAKVIEGQRLVAWDHGHRKDRERTAVPRRRAAQGAVPHCDEWHADVEEARSAQQGAEELLECMLVRGREEQG